MKANTTLKDLHLARKGISDDEGEELMKSLKSNITLEKLELEGNQLGKNTIRQVGEFLAINDSLKYIDLEGNELFDTDIVDTSSIIALAEGIKHNQCLLALNLSYCNLDRECGRLLAQALRENITIIHFDFRGNDFPLEIVRDITNSLKRNKESYNMYRLEEWKERKVAHKEDEYTEMIDITLQQEHIKKMSNS